MALQGQIPIEFGMVFPAGAYAAGGIEMVRDFDRSSGDRVVQQADKHTGLPLWVVEVIDAQEDARQRTVKVKIAAQVQPVLPAPAPGSPFTAVEFDGMTATPYVDRPAARATARASAPPGWRTPSRPQVCGLPRGGSAARRLSTRTRHDRPAAPGRAPVPAGRLPAPGGVRAVPGQGSDVRDRRRGDAGLLDPARADRGRARGLRPAGSRPRRGPMRWQSNAGTEACPRCQMCQSRTR